MRLIIWLVLQGDDSSELDFTFDAELAKLTEEKTESKELKLLEEPRPVQHADDLDIKIAAVKTVWGMPALPALPALSDLQNIFERTGYVVGYVIVIMRIPVDVLDLSVLLVRCREARLLSSFLELFYSILQHQQQHRFTAQYQLSGFRQCER